MNNGTFDFCTQCAWNAQPPLGACTLQDKPWLAHPWMFPALLFGAAAVFLAVFGVKLWRARDLREPGVYAFAVEGLPGVGVRGVCDAFQRYCSAAKGEVNFEVMLLQDSALGMDYKNPAADVAWAHETRYLGRALFLEDAFQDALQLCQSKGRDVVILMERSFATDEVSLRTWQRMLDMRTNTHQRVMRRYLDTLATSVFDIPITGVFMLLASEVECKQRLSRRKKNNWQKLTPQFLSTYNNYLQNWLENHKATIPVVTCIDYEKEEEDMEQVLSLMFTSISQTLSY